MSHTIIELAPHQLRRTLNPNEYGLDSTDRLQLTDGVIGQDRALAALRFGLGMNQEGFNIFVSGPPGIGKMTTVRTFLEDVAKTKETPSDWCYVNNFDDPYVPLALCLPAGMGHELQQDMKNLLEHVRREIPKAFESEEYGAKREEIVHSLESQRTQLVENFNQKARAAGFLIQITPFGISLVPVIENRTISDTEFQELPAKTRQEIQHRRDKIQEELESVSKQVRRMERSAQEDLQETDRKLIHYIVGEFIDDLVEKFKNLREVVAYLKSVQKAIPENIDIFKPGRKHHNAPGDDEMYFRKYQVNVLIDNSKQQGATVIVELNATYNNLFGRVEKESLFGALYTDFTLIRPGSLHRANGGYLVMQVEDILRSPWSWDGLKRMLRSKEIEIEELSERLGFIATRSLRPQPIPLNIKVVLVGPPLLHHLLLAYDPDFPEIFKVKADFDTRMERNEKNIRAFITFLCTFCNKENIPPLEVDAIGALVDHASRIAEDQERLSTQFGVLADLIREAQYWAVQEGAGRITGEHIEKAIQEKVYRSNMVQERLQEYTLRGTYLIDTSGHCVGQVNGLSVLNLGDYRFGRPSRITASVGPGKEGILDIEREVELGGPIHSKGVLILNGYLMQKYASNKPLTLSARLVFEQSYEEVEGDSASSTELYALLSALSGLPLDQGIAVTGSVNQHGEVQAIGGVNEKIEGFFDLCKSRGLTGNQGVIIPAGNRQNLMLRPDVVQAVAAHQFHVWSIRTIDEGIEILTALPAGERLLEDGFAQGTVNQLVEQRLRDFTACLRKTEDQPATV